MADSLQKVTLELGQVVDVSLDSMMGSTGYGWELASLEGDVNLLGMTASPSATGGMGSVVQVFTFRGADKGTGKATFVLAAPWKTEPPVQTIEYEFTVKEAVEVDESLKLKGFTGPQAAVRSLGTTILYAVQPPQNSAGDPRLYYGMLPPQDNKQPDPRTLYAVQPPQNIAPGDPRLYYGVFPPTAYYGMLPPQASSPMPYGMYPPVNDCCSDDCSTPQTLLKYNIPGPVMKYNFPQNVMKYNIPGPVMKYNFPTNDGCC